MKIAPPYDSGLEHQCSMPLVEANMNETLAVSLMLNDGNHKNPACGEKCAHVAYLQECLVPRKKG
jgi:hypothetical protein